MKRKVIYENECNPVWSHTENVEFRTPDDGTNDPRFAVKKLSGIVFYLTKEKLVRERIHVIDGSDYTVRSEFNRNTVTSFDRLIKRLIEAEIAIRYKNVS